MASQADGRLPDPTRRRVDEHDVTGLDLAQRTQRGQCRRPVQDQAERRRVGPARRHRYRGSGRHDHVLGEGTGTGTDDVGADGIRVADGRPDRHDLAGALEPGHVRRMRATDVRSAGLHHVGEVDPGGHDPD